MIKNYQHKYIYLGIFFICLLSRLLFKLVSGYDNFELFGDSPRYDMLSDRILEGNFDLDIVAFIPAPFYIYFLALCKSISAAQWELIAVMVQFFMVSVSSVYIYKLTFLLSKSVPQSILAALVYIAYPFTLYFNFTLSQETLFQSFFIIFLYYFFINTYSVTLKHTLLSSLFFALSLLTKSHIVILLPMIAVITMKQTGLKKSVYFFTILFLFTIPHGLINYKIHGVYTLSSYGSNSILLAGHSDETYPCLTKEYYNHPELNDEVCNLNIVFHRPYKLKNFGNINALPLKERNQKWREAAFFWIKTNPAKFWELKWNGFKRFILPGLDFRVYPNTIWIMSFLMGLLIYVPAYVSFYKKLKKDFWQHAITLSVIISIGIIFIGLYPQHRFRIITLEPLLIVYASFFYWNFIYNMYKKRRPTA